MPEEVLFKFERRMDRTDIAAALRNVADSLDSGEPVTVSSGDESITMDPPAQPTFEIKAEREYEDGSPDELSIEFELEWDEGESGADTAPGDLQIE
ncbi:amphi-Trp domain-containing protein [Halovivax gelatinilyticus]|uniref:amphi-Trp domain-containing protein n=1 Tax=Halovivax gelatinilyticus TaxID=2961597 RepID=UPI0020CA470D|nr:amphi-Trp domain-containing protein [Halovivax gelatinilyticus]